MKTELPAFPTNLNSNTLLGMSLRDYFAAMSINALLNDDLPKDLLEQQGTNWLAKAAYKIADEMMKAREL
jgi:hypothetical protein